MRQSPRPRNVLPKIMKLFLRLIILSVFELSMSTLYGKSWSYEDQDKWPGDLCHNGGRVQSPINIMSQDMRVDFKHQFISGKLNYLGYSRVLMSGKNNGRTIQFSSEGDPNMYPTLSGGPLRNSYSLGQIHFHYSSEHAIEGFKYPLEIHFVHIRNDVSVGEALQRPDGLAIISVFCNVLLNIGDEEGEALSEIIYHIDKLKHKGQRYNGLLLDLNKLLPKDRDSYYSYAGSLTSPTCNEVVIWIVYDTPIIITDLQYKIIGDVDIGSNFRSLQPIKDHRIFRPYISNFKKPKIIEYFNNFASYVTRVYNNITSIYQKYGWNN